MNRKKRGMLMIFVVIMIAAATTIIAALVDLGRMAVYKQKQSEREANWQYCVDSAKSLVVENLVGNAGTIQGFSQSVNGVNLTIAAAPDGSWNSSTSTQIAVTGILDGKTRTTKIYVGKRATINYPQFGMFFTDKFLPDSTVILTGDAYMAKSIDASELTITGDIYSTSATAPTVASQIGSYIGQQPGVKIFLNDAAYAAQASVMTSGTLTLNNPTCLLSLPTSQLRYHSGSLTISGFTTGEITIYVKGSVDIKKVTNSLVVLGRLVVICNGDVQIENGTTDVFVICNGKITSSNSGGPRVINGSLAGNELSSTSGNYTVNFNNYFVAHPDGGNRYWIPGQW